MIKLTGTSNFDKSVPYQMMGIKLYQSCFIPNYRPIVALILQNWNLLSLSIKQSSRILVVSVTILPLQWKHIVLVVVEIKPIIVPFQYLAKSSALAHPLRREKQIPKSYLGEWKHYKVQLKSTAITYKGFINISIATSICFIYAKRHFR